MSIVAGMPAQLTYQIYDHDSTPLDDVDIDDLTYQVYDVTNGAEVRAATAMTPDASGTISLVALDTQINGSGEREKRWVRLVANSGDYWWDTCFDVAESVCVQL